MTTAYYKATRPDGTDFYSGTILYEPGRTVRPAKTSAERRICGPGYLHAADVPAETLVGGQWPCRLFEVTGKAVAGFNGEHPHKGGFRQLRIERELPAHLALGPNGEQVAALIERTRCLTSDEAQRLHAAWDAAWDAAWYAARSARYAAWYAAWDAARYAARYAAWDAAWYAARYAASALVVKDLISTEQFNVLYEPWATVIDASDGVEA